jgi:ribosomal protein S18 acetylase RimI-like enzyme
MSVEIRPVRPEEFEEAGRVTRLAYEEFGAESWGDYARRLADVADRAERTLVLVAEEDGRILGTTTLELDARIEGGHPRDPLRPGEAHVRMLGVHPEARGRGIGRALMERSLEEARAQGKRSVTLNTTGDMVAARRMYESMGFRRLPDQVWPDGFRLMAYELSLDGG